ncbi:hypothetical protein FA048_09400 [Pedobacter polaris]|uniref:Uncharacterized protein n=1 Tax=Pedobacter polaris TaxID=2571273 RepID=A0A4U1CTI7_9SPHI|nr:hypothetical protein [Pedobacter polaris]TKC10395.1 hypothetical protein FA048_09400 [Pedobacter polaris]
MNSKEKDPRDKVTNAPNEGVITNSDLKDLPEQIQGSDADYDSRSNTDIDINKGQAEIEDQEINPEDNPEK